MAQTKTALELLTDKAAATGLVMLDNAATLLLELAYVEATTPDIDPKALPKAEDYWFWKRCRMVDAIR